ncbi:SDR family oxidoreductase [Bailinhaonella thermotolerans]|uniref:SDR family oxidoreductase n=1 Tax=Bailinhaonella thermotolerans TaxID=1070861 RepID=A0A3A4B0R8_9ACTN|nr:SDR family oxidoreductase [Bailinhaonella thermotolerans]RJL31703.1 SDR family oxidoreductase [Bailinhaonella thermotolerans]
MGREHPSVRAAVVTGGSAGIGAAIARGLGAAGHPVAVGARRVERCEEVARRIREDGGTAVAAALDLTDPDSVKRFAAVAEEALGPIEIVVSNAGALSPDPVGDLDADRFRAQLDVNLAGPQRLVSLLLPGMRERRRGDLVFVSSDVVRAPRPRMGAYIAAKHAVEGLARTMQMELEGTGVRASIVRPGPTGGTEMGADWDPATLVEVLDEWVRWGVARHQRFLSPDAVAAAVLAVVSAPPGTHLTLVEVEPEAPLRKRAPADDGPHDQRSPRPGEG